MATGASRPVPEHQRRLAMMPDHAADTIAATASVLASGIDRDRAVQDLIRLVEGRRSALERARSELVRRIRRRSDDYEATAGLTLLNAALAEIGWPAATTWEPRRDRRAG